MLRQTEGIDNRPERLDKRGEPRQFGNSERLIWTDGPSFARLPPLLVRLIHVAVSQRPNHSIKSLDLSFRQQRKESEP